MNKVLQKLLSMKSIIKYYRHKGITIGNDCEIYNVTFDNGRPYLIEIGDRVTLTNCTLLSHDASCKKYVKKSKVGKIKIGNNSFIGWGAIVLPNVKIGENCIVGAGCVVSKNIPDNSIVIGNPCRIIGNINDFKDKHINNMKKHPVYNKYWKYKTKEDKKTEIKELEDNFGYDI